MNAKLALPQNHFLLLNLKDGELAALSEKINENKGNTYLGVHVFFTHEDMRDYWNRTLKPKPSEKELQLTLKPFEPRPAVFRLFRQLEEKNLPLILLEEEDKIQKTAKKISEKYPRLQIYYLPTHDSTSLTKLTKPLQKLKHGEKASEKISGEEKERERDALAQKLCELGTKKAYVFGEHVDFWDGNGEKERPIFCAGSAYRELKKRLENVRLLSALNRPEQRPPSVAQSIIDRRNAHTSIKPARNARKP